MAASGSGSIVNDMEILSTAISLNFVATPGTKGYNSATSIPNKHKYFLPAYWVTSRKYRSECWIQLAKDVPPCCIQEFQSKCAKADVARDCMRDKHALVRDYKLAAKPTKADKKEFMSKLHYTFPSNLVCEEALSATAAEWDELDALAAESAGDAELGAEEAPAAEEEREEEEEEEAEIPAGVEYQEDEDEEIQEIESQDDNNDDDYLVSDNEVDYEFSECEGPEDDEIEEDEVDCNSPSNKRYKGPEESPTRQSLPRGDHSLEELLDVEEGELEEEAEDVEKELFPSDEGLEDRVADMEIDDKPKQDTRTAAQKIKDYEDAFFEARTEQLAWRPSSGHLRHHHALFKDAILKADAVVNPRDNGAVHSHGARYTECDISTVNDEGDSISAEQPWQANNLLSNDLLWHDKTQRWCAAPLYSNDALLPSKQMSTVSYADIKPVCFSAPNRQRLKWTFKDTHEAAHRKLIPVNLQEFSKRIRITDEDVRPNLFVNPEHPLVDDQGFRDYCLKKDRELNNLMNTYLGGMEMFEYLRKRNVCHRDAVGDIRKNRNHVEITEKVLRMADWAAEEIAEEVVFHAKKNNRRGIKHATHEHFVKEQIKKVNSAEILCGIIIGHAIHLPAKPLDLPKVIQGGKRCRPSPSKKDVGDGTQASKAPGRPKGSSKSHSTTKKAAKQPVRASARNTTKAAAAKEVDTSTAQVLTWLATLV
jgi:hypothetical protein